MIGPARVRRVAAETWFREEVVEKVLYLEAILDRLCQHPALEGAWVLKGGTALNLFWLDVPRLSVDIDINYIGQADLAGMQAERAAFEAAVAACCEREGCVVRRMPQEHAGGKLRLRYAGGVGGAGTLELDLNFLQRVPLRPPERRAPRFPPDAELDSVPVLSLEETAAGKFVALLTRRAARDAFDVWQLLELAPDLPGRVDLRQAFVVQMAGSRHDARAVEPRRVGISLKEVREGLLPLLRIEGRPFGEDVEALATHVNAACRKAAETLLAWSPRERAFLDRLIDDGEIAPDILVDDPARQALIRAQPLLQWKALNVRRFKGLPEAEGQ
ncbi:MAG: nucleotidyl transferase AbiEii/AbiGii toxin family protein [Candidatus Rokubacteria bacterium]|nr:nucleotidyl transferase AbiEii/AbiGii toxin family protein [Candidatus Rokubacteria bacterium]